jgi:hypothetical protein
LAKVEREDSYRASSSFGSSGFRLTREEGYATTWFAIDLPSYHPPTHHATIFQRDGATHHHHATIIQGLKAVKNLKSDQFLE